MILLVWKINGDSIGIDNLCINENVSLLSIQISSFQFCNVSSPHCKEHAALIRIKSNTTWFAQPHRQDCFTDQFWGIVFCSAHHHDFSGVIEEVPVHGGPVDGDLVDGGQGEHVRLRKTPSVDKVVDFGAEKVGSWLRVVT